MGEEDLAMEVEQTSVDSSLPISLSGADRRWYNWLKRLPALVDYITIIFCAIGPWLFFYVAMWALFIFLACFQILSIMQGAYLLKGALALRKGVKEELPEVLPKHYFAIIIPNYKEDLSTLRSTLDHYATFAWAKERFLVVLGMEGAEAECEEKANTLESEYGDKFATVLHSVHPRGLPGETSGKHSNERFAGEFAHEYFVQDRAFDIDSIIVCSMDSDTLHTERYFTKIEAEMQKNPSHVYNTIFASPFYNYQNMYDPQVPGFNANFDQLWAMLSLGILARSNSEFKFPASSYCVPMRFLRDLDFWDAGPEGIAEDEHMALKAFFATNGKVEIHTIYEVMNVGTVFDETIWKGIKAKLVQLRRHFQGNVDVGYSFAMMRRRFFRLGFWKHVQLSQRIFELFFLLTMSPIVGFVGWMQITVRVLMVESLQPDDFPDWGYTFVLTTTLVMNLTFVFIGLLIISAEIVKGCGPETHNTVPGNRKWWHIIKYLWMLLGTVAMVVMSIRARTSLLLDRDFSYVVAQKVVNTEKPVEKEESDPVVPDIERAADDVSSEAD